MLRTEFTGRIGDTDFPYVKPPPEWVDSTDLAGKVRRLETERHLLQAALVALCVDAEQRKGPHTGLIGAKRLRRLIT